MTDDVLLLQNRAAVDAYLARIGQLITDDIARSDVNPSLTVLRLRKLREERGGGTDPYNRPMMSSFSTTTSA